jgi:hypothetical protein
MGFLAHMGERSHGGILLALVHSPSRLLCVETRKQEKTHHIQQCGVGDSLNIAGWLGQRVNRIDTELVCVREVMLCFLDVGEKAINHFSFCLCDLCVLK